MSLQDQLHALFLLEQQVRGLRSRLDSGEARLAKHQERLTQLTQQCAEVRQQQKIVKTKASALELQMKEMEDKIARFREQMNSVKTNKEYSTLLIEANTLKVTKGKVEEEALAEMGKADELVKKITEMEDAVTAQTKMVALAQKEVTDCRAEIGARLDDLTGQRNTAAAAVPAEALRTFERLARIHDGEALAVVVEENRRHREYSCGGCYISLPIERISALLSSSDEIVVCPSCSRILYLDQDLKTAMAKK